MTSAAVSAGESAASGPPSVSRVKLTPKSHAATAAAAAIKESVTRPASRIGSQGTRSPPAAYAEAPDDRVRTQYRSLRNLRCDRDRRHGHRLPRPHVGA